VVVRLRLLRRLEALLYGLCHVFGSALELASPPQRAAFFDRGGRYFVRRGAHRWALELYRRATVLDGGNRRIWYHRAAAAVRGSNLEEAALCYRVLARLDPHNPRAHCRLAGVYELVGAPRAALDVCRRALEGAPDSPSLHRQLGRLLFNTGAVHSALRSLQRAADLSPSHCDTHYCIGLAMRQAGKLPEARSALRRALALRSDDPKLYYALGLCCPPDGDVDQPVALLLRGLAQERLDAGLDPPTYSPPPG
jgi:Flp pilus assembly protein TadD